MAVKRFDEYADLPAPIPADAIVLFEINPATPATRAYRSGVAASLLAKAGLVTGAGLTMNTAKILGRATAGVGAPEELDHVAGNFTPVATFVSPGTLAVSYVTQTGVYFKLARLIWFSIQLRFTPTLGTASGEFRITGFPFVTLANVICPFEQGANAVTWSAATATQAQGLLATDQQFRIRDQGSTDALQAWTTAQVTNGVERDFRLNGVCVSAA